MLWGLSFKDYAWTRKTRRNSTENFMYVPIFFLFFQSKMGKNRWNAGTKRVLNLRNSAWKGFLFRLMGDKCFIVQLSGASQVVLSSMGRRLQSNYYNMAWWLNLSAQWEGSTFNQSCLAEEPLILANNWSNTRLPFIGHDEYMIGHYRDNLSLTL
jgi:hypothetical protein